MYNLKSPPEKIRALFYQALKPAADALKVPFRPSDIDVTIAPIVEPTTFERERGVEMVKIDFSKTPFVPYLKGIKDALCLGASIVQPATIQFRENPLQPIYSKVLGYSVERLQQDLAQSLTLQPGAELLVDALSTAARGAARQA